MTRSGWRASIAFVSLVCLVFTNRMDVATSAPIPGQPLVPTPAMGVSAGTTDEPSSARAVATILEQIETKRGPDGITVILRGNGDLFASSIRVAEDLPPRLVLDFPSLESGVPSRTRVELGPIEKIRVAAHSHQPLVTRVVFDLRRQAAYRVELPEADERGLTVIFPDEEALAVEAEVVDSTGAVEVRAVDDMDAVEGEAVDAAGDVGIGGVESLPANTVFLDPMAALRVADAQRLEEVEEAEATGASTVELALDKDNAFGDPSAPLLPGSPSGNVSANRLPPATDHNAFSGLDPAPAPLVALPAPEPDSDISRPPPVRLVNASDVPEEWLPEPTAHLLSMVPAATESARQVASQLAEPQPAAAVPARPVRAVIRPAQVLQGQVGETQREYTGDPISLDFQDADLRSVLRTFAEINSLNIVIDPNVEGRIDVALRDVPWDQALDLILRSNRLGYIVDGTIIRIAPLTVLADEQAERRKLAEEQALSGALIVLTRTLSYARAANLAPLIAGSVLSPRGQIQVDERTNTLIITDLQEPLTTAEELITNLDRAEPQVEIEARIVQTNRNYARALGIQWGLNGRIAPELGNTTAIPFPNRGGVSGRTGTSQGPVGVEERALAQENVGTAVNLAATNASSAVGLTLGSINEAFNLDIALSALERAGQGRILSTPRITTQNNVTAQIVQGDQIPIQTVANNTVTVTFKDAALTLSVTPQITAANTVIMQIQLDNDVADFSRAVNGIPPIITQRATTTVQVGDSETTVIGGIFESIQTESHDRTPALHRLPLLGWLFKRDSVDEPLDELLIFITPRILR